MTAKARYVSAKDSDAKALWAALNIGGGSGRLCRFQSRDKLSGMAGYEENGCFSPTQNLHKNGILAKSTAPAPNISAKVRAAGNRAVSPLQRQLTYMAFWRWKPL